MKRSETGSHKAITPDDEVVRQSAIEGTDNADIVAEQSPAALIDAHVEQPEAELASYEASQELDEDEADDESDLPEEHPRRPFFVLPTREQLLNWLPFLAVILLGAILRFWGLGDKPLHHDESLHAYFSLQLMHDIENWSACFSQVMVCYRYDPLLHGPFQFHAIALVYKISQLLGAPDHGVNTTTVRIAAATLGSLIVALPYFMRDYLGKLTAWLACLLLAVSPSMLYFSRFAREDIYMACFTLLLVVAAARYIRSRKMGALILAAAAFALSYATKEATFLTILIFGTFFGAVVVWEIGLHWPLRASVRSAARWTRYLPRTCAPLALLLYFLVLAPIARVLFGVLKNLSLYITAKQNATAADLFMERLKSWTVLLVPWIGIALGLFVLVTLARELELFGPLPPPGRRGLAARVDPRWQPLLDTIVTIPWTHWFFALICGWTIFLLLFTVLFTNIGNGIGDGIWQGLYYWLQQQQVARGGQPWYYYLLLIPLYEQIGLVFGLVGAVRCLLRPTRFRLFLVWWCVGNFFIYSWAAEKMPWLTIHITMPMMLLAAIGLEPILKTLLALVRQWFTRPAALAEQSAAPAVPLPAARPRPVGVVKGAGAIFGTLLALALLAPTLQNMYQLSYVHAADGPHEMMVYVQTTTDVNIVMAKIDALDDKLTGGQRSLSIGVMSDADWPFHWYLRDYPNACFDFPKGCSDSQPVVILSGGDNVYSAQSQYAISSVAGQAPPYLFHQYHMRTWWDEGYKPPPCVPGKTNTCQGDQTWGGVGPLLWLSYGDSPPPHAQFNPLLAASNIWQWWWQRKAIGSTGGTYDMGLFIQTQASNQTGVTP